MRDIVQGFQTVDILEPEEKEEADENKCNEHNDVANQKNNLLSCLLHDKERVGKTVPFNLSNEMKQNGNDEKKTYAGSYGKTYYPTYANKAKGLCKTNNSK